MAAEPGRLRVLHCIYDDPGNPWVAGGGAVRVFELYRRLTDRVDATVVTGSYPGARDGVREGVRYLHLGRARPYGWSRLTYARAASRWLVEGDYDAAVFDFSTYTPLKIPTDRPVGITVHHVTGPSAAERWGPRLAGWLATREVDTLRRARVFTATSLATLHLLRGIVGPEPRIDLVQAGVPDDLFSLPHREEGYLLYFGRVDWHHKGLDTLLEAAAILAEHDPTLELRIAGRGKDLERVREAAERMGILPRLHLLGAVSEEEQRRLFEGATLLLMPSRFEGFGMVAAEAMAAGVPVVAAAAGSLPEVVDAPRGGRLVPPGDARALAAEAAQLLRSPEERAELSESARLSARRFSWDTVALDHLHFLEAVAAGAAAPSEEESE